MVKTVIKKRILLIPLVIAAIFLPSCDSVKDSGSSGGGSIAEDEMIGEDSNTEDDTIDEVVRCEIVFDSAGGTAVAAQIVLYGEKIKKPTDPTKPNDSRYEYSFDGWYLGDYEWNFEIDTVSEDMTLTAKWKIESEFTNPFLPSD